METWTTGTMETWKNGKLNNIDWKLELKEWKIKYPNAIIKGHYEVIDTKKTCPNFDVSNWCIENGL